MIDVLANLQLIAADHIHLHESHEKIRLTVLGHSLQESGVLRHPPIAVKMQRDQYLIIDGAHRTEALKMLGYQKIPVQVVEQSQCYIGNWEHVVHLGDWFTRLQRDPDLLWSTEPLELNLLVEIYLDQQQFWLYAAQSPSDARNDLNLQIRIVESYGNAHHVNRQPHGTTNRPTEDQALIRFPTFVFSDLEAVVQAGRTLPAGVTRFEIEGRLLNLFIPLQVLADSASEDEWARLMQEWQEKLRFYTKGVFLCG